jgi:ribonucleotide reductase alpha subunit
MTNILTEEFLEKYKNKQPAWGFSGLGYIVYKRTYARLLDNGQKEEWWQTVARCVNGAQQIGANYTKKEAETLYDKMFNLKCLFAGRMLWQLGTDGVERYRANALLNCWFVAVNNPDAFCFLFENLMLGGGVGFSVRREDIHELPKIKEGVQVTHQNTKDAEFIVPDSREGWVYLLFKVLKAFYRSGKSFTYSTILVRGKGEVIKGFGGVASGATILIDGIQKIVEIFQLREGKKLRSIDVLDVCNIISSIVIAGNVRRSATIALGDPDDYLFIRAKRWDLGNIPNYRAMSNNTIYADDFNHISKDIWAGYEGNGEPYGFFNLPLAQKYGRTKDEKIKDRAIGLNPCFTADTKIETVYGQIPVIDLLGKEIPVYCYDGNKIAISIMKNIRKTDKNQAIYKITLDNNETIKATANHKFMLRDGSYKELNQLIIGDSLMPFRRTKRNSKGYFNINLNNGTAKGEAHLVAEWKYSRNIKDNECVHHLDGNKQNNSPENLEILDFSQHNSDHMKGDKNPLRRMPHKNPMFLYPGIMSNEKNPKWNEKITIEDVADLKQQGYNIKEIAEKLNTTCIIVKKRLELAQLNNHKVKNIEFYGYEDVYDGEVEVYHNFALAAGVIVHNCGEITLESYECCNLSELCLNNIESKEEMIECAKLLYKTQKAINNLDFIHEETTEVVRKNMRIGLSVTGICQSKDKLDWLDDCYKTLKDYDEKYSKELKVNPSIKLTTVKPSGTLSLLAGATPGIHPAFSEYYTRRIRMTSDDELINVCKQAGYRTEYVKNFDGSLNHNTLIVEFPCFAGVGVITAKNMPAVEQLEFVKKMQSEWADNSVSCTVYYKKEELPEIREWLGENYKKYIKSVSFLLHSDHGFEQAPYEEITEQEYQKLIKNIKPIESNVLEGDSIDVDECKGGACPIR